MWKNLYIPRNTIILNMSYHDFASIMVEKKINNKGVNYFEISFHIEEVTNHSLNCYKLEDVKKILEVSKEEIEYLYEEKEDMSDIEIYDWLDNFVEVINDF